MPDALVRRADPLAMGQDEFVTWLRQHERTIGGSSVGAILGLNTYKSPADVWDGLLHQPGPRERRRNAMDRGTALEPIVATIYMAETGRDVWGNGTERIAHPEYWMFHATPDRWMRDNGPVMAVARPRGHGILEIKVLGLRTFAETKQSGIDPTYYAQLQWYLAVTGSQWGAFAVFNAEEWVLYHFDVPRDETFIGAMMDTVHHFWNEFVIPRVRPDQQGSIMPRIDAPVIGAEAVDLTTYASLDWARTMVELQQRHEAKKLAEQAYDLLVEHVKENLEAANVAIGRVPGVGTIRWMPRVTRTLDRDLLLTDYPDLDLTPYMRVTESRPFVPTWERRNSGRGR